MGSAMGITQYWQQYSRYHLTLKITTYYAGIFFPELNREELQFTYEQ